jgi:hypothetical protein
MMGWYCPPCERELGDHGMALHVRSKAHVARAGSADESVLIRLGDPPLITPHQEPNTSAVDAVVRGFENATVTVDAEFEALLAKMAAELAAKDAENATLRTQVADLKPTVEVEVYKTGADVERIFGKDKLDEVVEMRLGEINKQRLRSGLLPYDFNNSPEILARTRRDLLAEILSRRTKFAEENPTIRVVKMVLNGTMRQVPFEQQINNEAGQQGAAIWRMRDKGAKLCMPFLCMRNNCYTPAAVDDNGSLTLDGYCSAAHRSTDPYLKGRQVAGVTTSTPTYHMNLPVGVR